MKIRLMALFIILAYFFVPLASSSIFIEPLKDIYNYGDLISVHTTIAPSSSLGAHYTVDLKCEGDFSINIFNSFYNLQVQEERPVTVTTELSNPLVYNLTGPCYLKAVFGGETANSNSFTLSKEIIVDTELDFESLDPGEEFYISGTAVKKSGVPLDGFAEIFIQSLNLYKSSIVADGLFNLSLLIPANAKSGVHNFSLEIHNTDHNSRKINFGSYFEVFSVEQLLKKVEISLDSEEAKPLSDFTFRVDVLDQADDLINKDVSLTMNKPKGVPFIKKIIKSGETQKISFLLNDTPGYWSIETEVDGIKNRKLFYLSEINTLQTSLINNTLIVTNIGNSPYSGPLEITIGSFVEIKQIKLGPGETQKFTLRAPDGDYSISVLESGENKNLGSVFLTGNAVKVTDFREDIINTFTNPLIWWLGVILLILIIIFVQIRLRMGGHIPKAPSKTIESEMLKAPAGNANTAGSQKPKIEDNLTDSSKFDMSWLYKSRKSPAAESNISSGTQKISPLSLFRDRDSGIRERAVAVALFVGGNSDASDTLNNASSIARESGAKAYIDGDYRIIIFSPRLTHSSENEITAINAARRIQALFLEHISLHKDNFNLGVGVSDGEIISEIENGKFRFTSTGNLISYAKRLAHVSGSKLLISDSLRRKVMSKVRTEKTAYHGVWEVVRVIDNSSTRDFIKRFSDRNK